jgi:putative peptidoglycan lipid II flippase
VVQIGAYLDLLLASLLVTGSVAVLDFAQILYVLPISLFVIAIAAAELPELSRTTDDTELVERLGVALRRVEFFMVGSAVFFVVGGAALVGLVYQRGEFNASDTTLVWMTLACYSLGLVPTGASRLLQNGLFARGDTAGPAKIALARVAVAAGLGLVLMFQFEQFALTGDGSWSPGDLIGGDLVEQVGELPAPLEPLPEDERAEADAPPRLGVVGLALGSAAGAWLEYFLLRRYVGRRIAPPPSLLASVTRLLPAAAAAAVAMVAARLVTVGAPDAVSSLAVMGAGGAAFMGIAFAMGVSEARTLARR